MLKSVFIAGTLGGAAVANVHDDERTAMIEIINKMDGVKWTAGHNERFRGMPVHGSMKRLCGVHNTSTTILEQAIMEGKAIRKSIRPKGDALIPAAFDSETNWPECAKVIGDIRDQSNCGKTPMLDQILPTCQRLMFFFSQGCCWAFAAAEAASDRLCIATKGKTVLPLSAQHECFCASPDGCNGGDVFTPWEFLQSTGLVTGGQFNGVSLFPLCIARIERFTATFVTYRNWALSGYVRGLFDASLPPPRPAGQRPIP